MGGTGSVASVAFSNRIAHIIVVSVASKLQLLSSNECVCTISCGDWTSGGG